MTTTSERRGQQTYKDYRATPDDERWELLNGNLMRRPKPNRKHQWVLGNLARKLSDFSEEHRLGQVYLAPVDVVLSDTDIVEPDLLFISRAREHTRSPRRTCGERPTS